MYWISIVIEVQHQTMFNGISCRTTLLFALQPANTKYVRTYNVRQLLVCRVCFYVSGWGAFLHLQMQHHHPARYAGCICFNLHLHTLPIFTNIIHCNHYSSCDGLPEVNASVTCLQFISIPYSNAGYHALRHNTQKHRQHRQVDPSMTPSPLPGCRYLYIISSMCRVYWQNIQNIHSNLPRTDMAHGTFSRMLQHMLRLMGAPMASRPRDVISAVLRWTVKLLLSWLGILGSTERHFSLWFLWMTYDDIRWPSTNVWYRLIMSGHFVVFVFEKNLQEHLNLWIWNMNEAQNRRLYASITAQFRDPVCLRLI